MRKAIFELKNLYFVLFSIVLFIENNSVIIENIKVRYSAIIIMCIIAMFHFIKCRKIKLDIFLLWSIVVLFYMFISSFWGTSPKDTIQAVKNLLIVSLITAITSVMIEDKTDIQKIIWSMIWAFLAETVYILSKIGIADLGIKRIGAEYAELSQWNANAIGTFTSIGCVLSILCAIQKNRKGKNSIFEVFLMLFFLSITLCTGSRKALIIIVGTLLLFVIIYNGDHKRWRNIFFTMLVLFAVVCLILVNDDLYTLIGARMIRMFQELLGYKTTENSMSLRKEMIFNGLKWFSEKPILGYGLDGFAELYGQSTGWKVYSHCNFIEILVGGGIIGFLLYYFIYFYIIEKLRREIIRYQDLAKTYFFSIILILFFNNTALVCYSDVIYISMLMLAGSYLKFGLRSGNDYG